jgi:hypothetical protein
MSGGNSGSARSPWIGSSPVDPADDDRLRDLLTLIAGTVSYLHIHTLVELHGSAGLGAGADLVLGRGSFGVIRSIVCLGEGRWLLACPSRRLGARSRGPGTLKLGGREFSWLVVTVWWPNPKRLIEFSRNFQPPFQRRLHSALQAAMVMAGRYPVVSSEPPH